MDDESRKALTKWKDHALYAGTGLALIYHMGLFAWVFYYRQDLPYHVAQVEVVLSVTLLFTVGTLYGYYKIRGARLDRVEDINAMLRAQMGRAVMAPERRDKTWISASWRDRNPNL